MSKKQEIEILTELNRRVLEFALEVLKNYPNDFVCKDPLDLLMFATSRVREIWTEAKTVLEEEDL